MAVVLSGQLFLAPPSTMQRALLLLAFLVAPPCAAAASQPVSALCKGDEAKEVELKTSDSLTLHGSYFEPKKSTQPAPGAILVHDSSGSRAELLELADRMWKTGFAVLVVDLRGHGASATKDLTWEKLSPADQKQAWTLALNDIDAASLWLRGRKEVHATNLNLVGYRAGCGLAARFALRDENVRSVVLVEPRADELGIDIKGDLTEFGGLPTYIVSCKENSKATEAMISEAHKAAGGDPYIELMVCAAGEQQAEPAIERKVLASIAKWTKERAFPQK
jgi:dienelactone hydrolase